MVANIVTELVEGLVFVAASNLHWGGKRWKYPKVASDGYLYMVEYTTKYQHR